LRRSELAGHFQSRKANAGSMAGSVSSYQLYILNPFDGRIVERREFVAKNDETAVWISEGLRHSRPMELWAGPSKVHGWDSILEAPSDEREEMALPAIPIH